MSLSDGSAVSGGHAARAVSIAVSFPDKAFYVLPLVADFSADMVVVYCYTLPITCGALPYTLSAHL